MRTQSAAYVLFLYSRLAWQGGPGRAYPISRLCSFVTIHAFIFSKTEKHFKNEQRSRDAAANKRANTSGVGKINNYCEDIYVPPYNSTH